MAINSLDVPGDKAIPKLQTLSNSFKTGAGNSSTCKLIKIDFAEDSIYSASSKHSSRKSSNAKSPYLSSDNVHLLSQVTEKTLVHKKDTGFSSFPLAVNIYKASSDEFKSLKRPNRKAKKSVLTLPNNQAPMPQICTVSDVNDSEYFNQDDARKKLRKRNPVARNRKSRPRARDYEFYDRDAKYCSQMNIDLDCSSTDIIENYNGHANRGGSTKSFTGNKQQIEEKPNPHDVWAVLRNINRFQFRPSPPMSEDSFINPKKNKGVKRRNNRKDNNMRVVETCRTEEFAYISSYEVDSRSPQSFSKSSSFDRITVIDKQDEFSKICEEFEKRIVKTKNAMQGKPNKPQNKNPNKSLISNRNMIKTKNFALKSNSPKALEFNSKKQCNNNCGDTKQNKIRDVPIDVNKNEFDNPLYQEVNQLLNKDGNKNLEHEFIYSGNSGSSQADIEVINKNVPGKTKLEMDSSDNYNTLKGITKVVLSKGPDKAPPKKPDPPKRIRQATLLSSRTAIPNSTISTVIPKLTQTDIRRRLAKLKFPIVILGKDQISSNFEVIDQNPFQFHGLTEKVWPFMVQWQKGKNDKRVDALQKKTEVSTKKKYSPEILECNKTQKIIKGFNPPKQQNSDKKNTNDSKNKMVKVELKRITPPAELQQQTLTKKPKPIHQLKEKVLKLLYKNLSSQNFVGENIKTDNQLLSDIKTKPARKFVSKKIDVSTETQIRTNRKEIPRKSVKSPVRNNKQVPTARQPWAKAKWASDFIDNVIRKIKTGVYYTHESKQMNQNNVHECKDTEIQTIATSTQDIPVMQSISKITIKKKKEPITIPGFDDANSLPVLEIKTMNTNEISVKHCVANIIVHFDVIVPTEPVLNLKKSSSLITLQGTESQKNFKCKTSLINAMLPAELCSILPKMMSNIIESHQGSTLPLISLDKTISHLSTISEITRCESPDTLKFPLFCHLQMTLELQNLVNGSFMIIPKRKRIKCHVKYNSNLAKDLLARLTRGRLFDIKAKKPCLFKKYHQKQPAMALKEKIISETNMNTCTALLPYYPTSDAKDFACKHFDMACLQKFISFIAYKKPLVTQALSFLFKKNITINLTRINRQGLENHLFIDLGKIISASLENKTNIHVNSEEASKINLPAIQYVERKAPIEKNIQNQTFLTNKTKKRGFVRLYRKCKSASNIVTEKNTTSLNKITCIDDFFQALGTAKLLSGVFDKIYSHKILLSLKEMKNWITDINPTQALLLLLLVNKKDTPNMVRFRPVLLQGIAVNRITRANELDMEIEVIERENLNRLSKYEGISYVVASAENQDNLLEELYWIAKTTASDYQRTFDDSSEKLLKSLLEKRKKLNPSYLRVMARYVGLGLLKPPNKK